MKVTVIGSNGNMGRRYMAILKSMNVDAIGVDVNTPEVDYGDAIKCAERAIVATPIWSHYELCKLLMANNCKYILCEKPVTKYQERLQELDQIAKDNKVDFRWVCNWKYLVTAPFMPDKQVIKLNYYNTGRDGYWDLIQPIYLAKRFTFKNDSPVYDLKINGYAYSQIDFDKSYVRMISNWVRGCESFLWGIQDAIMAHNKLMLWKERHWIDRGNV